MQPGSHAVKRTCSLARGGHLASDRIKEARATLHGW